MDSMPPSEYQVFLEYKMIWENTYFKGKVRNAEFKKMIYIVLTVIWYTTVRFI